MRDTEIISDDLMSYWMAGMRLGKGETGNLWYWTAPGWSSGPEGRRSAIHFKTRSEAEHTMASQMLIDGRPELLGYRTISR